MNPRPHIRIAGLAFCLPLLLCGCGFRQSDSTHVIRVKSEQVKSEQVKGEQVKSEVRSFARSVAEDVTRVGPPAWANYFENSPSFFMAVDGRVEFADGAAAQAAIPDLSRTISKIELHWGDGLRVDPLNEDLAVIGTPWHEIITLADGPSIDASGYFTAVAGKHDGHWKFRNAHWSTTQPTGPAK